MCSPPGMEWMNGTHDTLLIEHLLHAGPVTYPSCSVSTWPISCVVITYANEAAVTFHPCLSSGCPESRTDEDLGADGLLGKAPGGCVRGWASETEKPVQGRVMGLITTEQLGFHPFLPAPSPGAPYAPLVEGGPGGW